MDLERTRGQVAETTQAELLHFLVARVEGLLDNLVTVGKNFEFHAEFTLDGRDGDQVDRQTAIVRCEANLEQRRGELGVLLTWVQGT